MQFLNLLSLITTLEHKEQSEWKSFNLLQNKTGDRQLKIIILCFKQLSMYDTYK